MEPKTSGMRTDGVFGKILMKSGVELEIPK
jgi:hypothetical protein